MPQIWSCDAEWYDKLKNEQEKVVVAVWSSHDEKVNPYLEKLQVLEDENIPVFIVDKDSCGSVAEKIGAKPGETVIFKGGKEVGRVTLGENIEADIEKVRELTKGGQNG